MAAIQSSMTISLPQQQQIQQEQQQLQQQVLEQPELPQQQQQQQQPPTANEKRRMVQRQLVLLLHARKCQRLNVTNGVAPQPCQVNGCLRMKNVLDHMRDCVSGRACTGR